VTYSRRLPLSNASGESIRFYLPEALAAKEAAAVDPEAPLQARSEEQRIRRLRRAVERLKRQKGDEADRVKRRGRGVLYLGHLPWGFYEEEQFQYFSQYGKVTRLRLTRSRRTGGYKGYGWIEFLDARVAKEVAAEHDGMLLRKKFLVCKVVPPAEVHPETFRNCDRKFRVIDWAARDKAIKNRLRTPREMLRVLKKRVSRTWIRWDKQRRSNDPARRFMTPLLREAYDEVGSRRPPSRLPTAPAALCRCSPAAVLRCLSLRAAGARRAGSVQKPHLEGAAQSGIAARTARGGAETPRLRIRPVAGRRRERRRRPRAVCANAQTEQAAPSRGKGRRSGGAQEQGAGGQASAQQQSKPVVIVVVIIIIVIVVNHVSGIITHRQWSGVAFIRKVRPRLARRATPCTRTTRVSR
jgi:nucleolar protein 15